jgi:four helix bundle protein
MHLDYGRLDVCRLSLDFAACSYDLARALKSLDRHAWNQLLRASQSVTLNIAEGCGKFPSAERRRLLQIAGESGRECGAILDILCRCHVIPEGQWRTGKEMLARMVAMLARMMSYAKRVRDDEAV